MMKTPSTTRKVINIILIVIVALLLIQNLDFVSVSFLLFDLRMPLILVIAGAFLIGWYTSKSFGGEFDVDKIQKSINSVESKVENSMGKASEKVKGTVEDIKEHFEDAKQEIQKEVKKMTPKKSTPARRPAAKKAPAKKSPARKPAKK